MAPHNLAGRAWAVILEQARIDCSREHFQWVGYMEKILEVADAAVVLGKVVLVRLEKEHMRLRPMKMVSEYLEIEEAETSSEELQPLVVGQLEEFLVVEQRKVP
jgi:hypothetical protein